MQREAGTTLGVRVLRSTRTRACRRLFTNGGESPRAALPAAKHSAYGHGYERMPRNALEPSTAALRRRKHPIDETFRLVDIAPPAKPVGQTRQPAKQNLATTPVLKSPMSRFAVRAALRQHVPLSAQFQYTQCRFEDSVGGHQFTPRPTGRYVLLGKSLPECAPVLLGPASLSRSSVPTTRENVNFEMGSTQP